MSVVYYSIDLDSFFDSKSYLLRIYKNDSLIKTVNFPISNPYFPQRVYRKADKFGRVEVAKIMDMELCK